MVLELVVPGGITFCLGLSTLLVAGFYHTGYEQSPVNLMLLWAVSTFVFCVISYFTVGRFIRGESYQDIVPDEEDEVIGERAIAEEDITSNSGRVHFRGTSWIAHSPPNKTFKKGDQVTIVATENLTLLVDEDEQDKYENLKQG